MKRLLFALVPFLMFGCVVKQNLGDSYRLNPGMTKDEVIAVLGPPILNDFYKNVEEWHYCKTGFNSDFFTVHFFIVTNCSLSSTIFFGQ
jgi:hypothetical protein